MERVSPEAIDTVEAFEMLKIKLLFLFLMYHETQ